MEQIFSVHIYLIFSCGMFETFFFSFHLPARIHTHIGRASDDVESEFLRTGSIAPSFFFVGDTRQARLGKVRPASLVGYRPSDPACLACAHSIEVSLTQVPGTLCIYVTLVIILQNRA